MESKILELNFFEEKDHDDCVCFEQISGQTESGTKVEYSVSNLSECPEDAIIGRDLISVDQIVEYIKLGIALAAEGYTDVVIKE